MSKGRLAIYLKRFIKRAARRRRRLSLLGIYSVICR